MWTRGPILALFQITRNPLQLKNWLRLIRVGLGPTTALWSATTAVWQVRGSTSGSVFKATPFVDAVAVVLSLVSLICNFLAIVIFRPDNSETFRLLAGADFDNNVWPIGRRIKVRSQLRSAVVAQQR